MEYKELLKALRDNATDKMRLFSEKLVNTATTIIGCTNSTVQSIANSIDLATALTYPYNKYYEVDMVKGWVIATVKTPFQSKLPILTEFAKHIDNWSVCDCIAGRIKQKCTENQILWDFCVKLTQRPNIFEQRFGIVLMMKFIDNDNISKILSIINSLHYGEYYLDMGAAWLISVCFIKCRDATMEYLSANNNLTPFVNNKALQKIRDSFRVTAIDKELTKNMKK